MKGSTSTSNISKVKSQSCKLSNQSSQLISPSSNANNDSNKSSSYHKLPSNKSANTSSISKSISTDFKSLKQRLIMQINSSTTGAESGSDISSLVPGSTRLRPHEQSGLTPSTTFQTMNKGIKNLNFYDQRPALTLNFQRPKGSENSTTKKEKKSQQIGCLSVEHQESLIIQDVLFCLIGIEGTFIKTDWQSTTGNTEKTSDLRHLTETIPHFTIDSTLDMSLRVLVERILPLAQHYSRIILFYEKHSQMNRGCVNQALSGAMYSLIKDYFIFVAQLDDESKQRDGESSEMTLNKIWFYIQPTLQTMALLDEICIKVEESNARSGKTLTLLHQMIVCHRSNDSTHRILDFLIQKACRPYFEILTRWINFGIICDYGSDFYVADNELIERCVLPVEYSDDYWERRYSTRDDDYIPSFLKDYSDMILRTGKYLNVIQQCDRREDKMILREVKDEGNVIFTPKELSFADPSATDEEEADVKKDEINDIVEVEYHSRSEEYAPVIEAAYASASKRLLKLIVHDVDLLGHLASVKSYFLLSQGDFISQFLDLCASELADNVNVVEPSRIESLLELALRISSANSDVYKDNLGIELLPFDLCYQMANILSINTQAESDCYSSGPPSTDNLTALEAFAFTYEVEWPISIVLNRKTLSMYQMIFRHLVYCKHVETCISNSWVATKVRYSKKEFNSFAPSFALRQKMLNFLQNLEYYMTFEVIEPTWNVMLEKISVESLDNVDQVLEAHSDFLNTCLKDCLLSTPEILTTIQKMLRLCAMYAAYVQNSIGQIVSASQEVSQKVIPNFMADVKKFDAKFNQKMLLLLSQISETGRENLNERISNLLHRLDFDGFYNSKIKAR